MSDQIQVTGLKKVVRDLKVLNERAVAAVKELNLKAAQIVAASARSKAPRKTGRLAGSIRVSATRNAATVKAGSKAVPYAAPIHWGWPSRGIEPNKFVYGALDEHRPEIIAMYERRMREITERPGKL